MEVILIIVGIAALIYVLWRLFVWNTRRRMVNAFTKVLATIEPSLDHIERVALQSSPLEARHSFSVIERELCGGLAHLARKLSMIARTPAEASDWGFISVSMEKGITGLYDVEPVLQTLGQPYAARLAIRVADRMSALLNEDDSA